MTSVGAANWGSAPDFPQLPNDPGTQYKPSPKEERPPLPSAGDPERIHAPAQQPWSIIGTAADPKVKWDPNPEGVTRTIDQAAVIAKQFGVEIPDYVSFTERPSILNNADEFARYCSFDSAKMRVVRWKDFFEDGKLLIRVDANIFKSDEGIVGVYAHELHEIMRLKELFDEIYSQSNGKVDYIPIERLHELINGKTGHLHLRAWDVSDSKILEMRKANYYGTGIRKF